MSARFLQTPETTLHYELHGDSEPVTVFAHGVASSIDDVRFLASGVRGTRVFFHFRGHGRSGTPQGRDAWGYPAAVRDLRAVADHVGATACLGVSLGAGALLGCLAESPERFERVVVVLPAGLDVPRPVDPGSDLAQMARLIDVADVPALTALLVSQLPAELAAARGVDRVMARRAADICRPGVALAIRALPDHTPVSDRAALSRVRARALVVGHEGDDTHPAELAREVAAALPGSQLEVFAQPWMMLRERAALRGLIAGFLNG